MTAPRTHLHASTCPARGPVALCRWWGGDASRYTTDEDAVTCKRCQAAIAEAAAEGPTYAERLEAGVGHVVSGMGTRMALALPSHEHDPDRVRQWPNWRMAVRDSYRAALDGPPLKSTTATSRFGQKLDGGGSGFAPEGDAGQRQVDRFYAVRRALGSAYADGFVAMTQPRRWVPPDECLAILRAAVVGRVAYRDLDFKRSVNPGEKRARGTIHVYIPIERKPVGEAANAREDEHRRDDESDVQIYICGPASKRLGFEVTAGHVLDIVRMGGRAIEADLADGKWLATCDESLHPAGPGAEGDEMAGKRLRGWAEISDYLRRSEDTLKRACRWDPPLPVRYVGRIVEANTDELDEWTRSDPQRTIDRGNEAVAIAGRVLAR